MGLSKSGKSNKSGVANLTNLTNLITKAKRIFGINQGSYYGNQTSQSKMEQMIRLLTGDSPNKNRIFTPEEMAREYRGWIYTCANINSAAVASTPLRLYAVTADGQSNKYLHKHRVLDKREIKHMSQTVSNKALTKINSSVEVVELVEHPLLDLLREFNDDRNYFESVESTSIFLDMIGNSYWYLDFDGMPQPQKLYVLQSQYVTIVPGKTKLIKGYLYGKSNNANLANLANLTKFKPDEIIHFKTPNPNSIYYGIGCAQASAMSIERSDLIDTSENSTLKNRARPDFVVQYKGGKLDPSSKKDIEKMWNNAFQGARRSGRIKVMDEQFDLKTLGFKPEEMEYPQGRIWTLKEIAGAFGVPYSMLDSSDTKKATSEDAKLWHSTNAVLPRLKRIEEKLNEKLVPYYDNRLFLAFDNPIPEDVNKQTNENNVYVSNGVMSINEVRRSLGLPPFEDNVYEQPFAKDKVLGEIQTNVDDEDSVGNVEDVDDVPGADDIEDVAGDNLTPSA